MSLQIIISFLLGMIAGGATLAVASSLIRKQIENGVKAELAKLFTHAATVVAAASPKVTGVTPQ